MNIRLHVSFQVKSSLWIYAQEWDYWWKPNLFSLHIVYTYCMCMYMYRYTFMCMVCVFMCMYMPIYVYMYVYAYVYVYIYIFSCYNRNWFKISWSLNLPTHICNYMWHPTFSPVLSLSGGSTRVCLTTIGGIWKWPYLLPDLSQAPWNSLTLSLGITFQRPRLPSSRWVRDTHGPWRPRERAVPHRGQWGPVEASGWAQTLLRGARTHSLLPVGPPSWPSWCQSLLLLSEAIVMSPIPITQHPALCREQNMCCLMAKSPLPDVQQSTHEPRGLWQRRGLFARQRSEGTREWVSDPPPQRLGTGALTEWRIKQLGGTRCGECGERWPKRGASLWFRAGKDKLHSNTDVPSSIRLPRCLSGKGSACQAGDTGLISRSGRSPGGGNGNPPQYSCLEIPWTADPGRLQSMGSQRMTRLSNWTT